MAEEAPPDSAVREMALDVPSTAVEDLDAADVLGGLWGVSSYTEKRRRAPG